MGRMFIIIGAILGVTANIIGIGYGLYLWGGEGLAFGLAAWIAFKLRLGMLATALVSIVFGTLIPNLRITND